MPRAARSVLCAALITDGRHETPKYRFARNAFETTTKGKRNRTGLVCTGIIFRVLYSYSYTCQVLLFRRLSHPTRSALWRKPRPTDGRDLPATGRPALRRPLRHEQREKSGLCLFQRKLRQYLVSRETSSSSSPTRPTSQSRTHTAVIQQYTKYTTVTIM